MFTEDAKHEALRLMREHGLIGWRFAWSNAKRTLGMCEHSTRTIKLSRPIVRLNDRERVVNTILHEIAHALTPGEGHSETWRRKAIEIGCDGRRCAELAAHERPASPYVATCETCGTEHPIFRRTRSILRGSTVCVKTDRCRIARRPLVLRRRGVSR